MRFVLLIFSVSQMTLMGTAHAGSRAICDQLLSSSSLTSVSDAPIAQLSASAKAFVNLIQLYIDKSGGPLDETMSNAISSANEFINPFASRKDSLSLQFSKGIEAMRSRINSQDWVGIKQSLVVNEEKNKAMQADRTKKDQVTATLFSPKNVGKVDFAESQENIELAPTWVTVKGRTYAAVISSFHDLYLYELVKGKLKLLARYETGSTQFSAAAWQVVDGRVYLAAANFSSKIELFELVKNELIFRHKAQSMGNITTSVTWQKINGRYFIAVAGHQYINVFELIDGQLLNHKYESFETRVDIGISWHVSKGRAYLAVITKQALHIFEALDNEFVLRAWSGDSPRGDLAKTPVWYETGGRLFIAVGGHTSLHLFEFIDGQMGMEPSLNVVSTNETGDLTSPVWQVYGGRSFLLIGAGSGVGGLYVFELVDGRLVPVDNIGINTHTISTISAYVIKDRFYIAVGSYDENLHFYELAGGVLGRAGALRALAPVSHISKWQKVGNQYFIIFSSTFGTSLEMASTFEVLKKQGGRK